MKLGMAWLAVVLGLMAALLSGCSSQPGVLDPQPTPASSQQLPFDTASARSGRSPTGSLALVEIPSGTEIVVRLRSSISSATANPEDSFRAMLDEPIVVGGETIVPRGALLTGRIVAAKASGQPQEAGYLRLTLTSISIGGKSQRVHTSSIFVKGGGGENRNLMLTGGNGRETLLAAAGPAGDTATAHATLPRDIELPAEHMLVFRLAQTLSTQP